MGIGSTGIYCAGDAELWFPRIQAVGLLVQFKANGRNKRQLSGYKAGNAIMGRSNVVLESQQRENPN